jgi:hypothetical protein
LVGFQENKTEYHWSEEHVPVYLFHFRKIDRYIFLSDEFSKGLIFLIIFRRVYYKMISIPLKILRHPHLEEVIHAPIYLLGSNHSAKNIESINSIQYL